jgi:hypothetical protein
VTEFSNQRQPDLLAYALFDLDPRVRSLRQPLLTFLVSLALFERGRPATREELLNACRDQFLSNDEMDRKQIDRVVSASTTAGLLVDAGGGAVDLSPNRRSQLNEAARRIEAQRDAFHREISKSVELELGDEMSQAEHDALKIALEDFIQRLFQEQSVALAQIFGPNGTGFDHATAGHLTGKSLDSLARAIAPASEKLQRAQVAQGIRKGLLGLRTDGQKYLAAVYQRTVAFALLQQDPSIRKVKRDLAKKRQFYLDTNVVMALLFSAHTQHERVSSAVKAARDIGCRIVVSPYTVDELDTQIRESDEAYRRLKSQEKAFSIVDDDILRTFALKREESPGIRWRAFYAKYFPPKDALSDFDIDIETAEAPDAHHDSRRDRVRAAVGQAKPPNSHPKVIDYDTDNLILIQHRREQLRADEMGSRVWLITLDTGLKYAERRLVENAVYAIPSAKRIGAWTADLSPHLSPDDADLGEYALHLVQSQLGLLAEDPVFADVNFLLILEKSPFDVEELLEASPEMSRRVLVALQEEREIQAVLKERPEEPEEQDAWTARLVEAVRLTLAKLDRSAETEATAAKVQAERDRALRRVASARRERDESLRRISELERELKRTYAKKSWMERLKKWLARST